MNGSCKMPFCAPDPGTETETEELETIHFHFKMNIFQPRRWRKRQSSTYLESRSFSTSTTCSGRTTTLPMSGSASTTRVLRSTAENMRMVKIYLVFIYWDNSGTIFIIENSRRKLPAPPLSRTTSVLLLNNVQAGIPSLSLACSISVREKRANWASNSSTSSRYTSATPTSPSRRWRRSLNSWARNIVGTGTTL